MQASNQVSMIALIRTWLNIDNLKMDQMTMYDVQSLSCSDKPTENNHSALQSPSTFWSSLLSFSSLACFGFTPLSSTTDATMAIFLWAVSYFIAAIM